MKKASELSVLCNADVGVIVFSCTGRLYEFGSSCISQILRRYNTVNGPALLQAQPDPSASHLLAQQAEEIRSLSEEVERLREEEAEEIRSLREEVKRLESENLSLVKDLEQQLSNSQPVCYENANLETTLTLRPPSSNADLRMEILELPKMESGSTNSMSQMEM